MIRALLITACLALLALQFARMSLALTTDLPAILALAERNAG